MPSSTKFTYKCEVCDKQFSHKTESKAKALASNCEKTHDVVYVQLLKSDVQRLLAFIASKEDSLITEALYKRLRRYRTLK